MTKDDGDIVERLREKQRRCKGSNQHATWVLCAEAADEITRLRAQPDRAAIVEECAQVAVRALVEALRPFADAAISLDALAPRDSMCPDEYVIGDALYTHEQPTVGDLRRARSVLAKHYLPPTARQ